MDLYLWKAPVIDDPDEARRLVDHYLEQRDESAFEPSADIALTRAELVALYPPGEDSAEDPCPWAEYPFFETDRLLILSLRWSAPDLALEEIQRLAFENGLLIYDPQGPEVYLPGQPVERGPPPRLTAAQLAKSALMVVPFALATYAFGHIPWAWLRWPLLAVGLFFTAAALFVLFAGIASTRGWLDPKPAS